MTEPTLPAYDLFVSHAKADRDWVHGFLLPALGLPKERRITREDFVPGEPETKEFERAIRTSRYTLLVLSPAYLADAWAEFGEQLTSHARVEAKRGRLVPLLLKPCELPLRLDFLIRQDCTDPARWEAEAGRLRGLLDQPEPPPEKDPDCPYPGMVPFREQDARFFFGREGEIFQMVQHLRHHRLLFLIGSSGSGKSSLIRAGLLPELARGRYSPADSWLVRAVRPGAQPLQALAQALGGDPDRPGAAAGDLLAAHPPAQRLLLVVDQFEELFALNARPEQVRFVAALKALREVKECVLIVAMRADFYPDLMNSDLWPIDPGQRMEIIPLRGDALRRAVEEPALKVGVYLEPGLVERLLGDAADEPGVLPMVQETMVLLWGRRARRLLPLRAYEELGGGGRSGLAVAVATKADATLADLSPAQQTIARRVFLRLVQFGEGRGDTRRQQRLAELRAASDDEALFDRTLAHLADQRLLTLSGAEGGPDRKVDIAHEVLITGWPRAQDWLRSRREAELTRRRLNDKAREWERLQGRDGFLGEVELLEAERWLAGPDAADLGYDERLLRLVEASRARINAERTAALRHALDLEKTKDLTAVLNRYFAMHDALLQAEMAYRGVAASKERAVAGAEPWDRLLDWGVQELATQLAELLVLARDKFSPVETPWTERLERARHELLQAVRGRDAAAFNRAAERVRRVIGTKRYKVQWKVAELAGQIGMAKAVEALRGVQAALRDAPSDKADQARRGEFARGVEALDHLDRALHQLIANHYYLEELGDIVRDLDPGRSSAEEIADVWGDVRPTLSRLNGDGGAPWVARLKEAGEQLGVSLVQPPAGPGALRLVRRQYQSFCAELQKGFVSADNDLATFVTALQDIFQRLADVLQALQPA